MLVGVNQFYLLNEHLLVQNETRVVSQISGTNESINGKHHLEYRCKKASLQFHNRVSNLYILSAPSWILLLCIFALGAAQGGRRQNCQHGHRYGAQLANVRPVLRGRRRGQREGECGARCLPLSAR